MHPRPRRGIAIEHWRERPIGFPSARTRTRAQQLLPTSEQAITIIKNSATANDFLPLSDPSPAAHTAVSKPIAAAINTIAPSNETLPPSKSLSKLRKVSKKDARSTWDRLVSGYKDKSGARFAAATRLGNRCLLAQKSTKRRKRRNRCPRAVTAWQSSRSRTKN
ncbi:hypothetical protein V2G26_019848 [Clonostachys chloroleuca]